MKKEVKRFDLGDPETIYLLESADPETRTGVLKYKSATPKNAPWTTVNVALSTKLSKRIAEKNYRGLIRPAEFIGCKFQSTLTSPVFSENPFMVKKFVPVEGSDVPLHYELCLVMENWTPATTLEDAVGNQVSKIRNWRPDIPMSRWLRFKVQNNSRMLSEISENVVIVKP